MTVLARQVKRSEPDSVDAVHEAVRFQEYLHNVAIARPGCFVERSVSELYWEGTDRYVNTGIL